MKFLKELLKRKSEIEEHIKNLQLALSETMDNIESVVTEPLKAKRQADGKDTGSIDILLSGVTVKQNIPKTVVWDQDILKGIYIKIKDADDDPENYLEVKYNVPEKKYSAFPLAVQTLFDPARTVKAGKPKLTFKIEEE